MAAVEPFAAFAHEKRLFRRGREQRPHPQPEEERPHRGVAQGRDAFLAALAHDPYHAAGGIDVVHVQIERFGNAQPRTVEQLRQRQIAGVRGPFAVDGLFLFRAFRSRRLRTRLVEEAEHLVYVQRDRMADFPLGVAHQLGGIGVDAVHLHQIAVQGTQGRKLAAYGAARLPLVEEVGGEILKMIFFQFPGPGEGVLFTVEPFFELFQIAAVGRDRGRGKAFLDGHPFEEVFGVLGEGHSHGGKG